MLRPPLNMPVNLSQNVHKQCEPSVRYIWPAWQPASVGVVNICPDVDDNFYCYRLPHLNRIESKDNGMKIVVPNMFFHWKLGARTTPKSTCNEDDVRNWCWGNSVERRFTTQLSVNTNYKLFTAQASDVKDLAGFLKIEVSAADAWFEKDELIYVHPKDPWKVCLSPPRTVAQFRGKNGRIPKRIDVPQIFRQMCISPMVSGLLRLVFETGLHMRTYIPLTDVRVDLLGLSNAVTEWFYISSKTLRRILFLVYFGLSPLGVIIF
ncbi:uncharacterized protein BJ212DRAFT_1579984 [Suillus subaureus]|uniref:Uncharacterized protein n=1 Tax=Suillus subaureus TaxID=48587 RepID=A0A9P7E1G4_9AGAM|nr:uncharacterized protein BJ212DRAFT_1579984 [Suillus subaureus]KAG1808397.1 hypothetical protein BJ212DRAFT_1579984 [Suillus subaureus]